MLKNKANKLPKYSKNFDSHEHKKYENERILPSPDDGSLEPKR